MRYSTGSFGKTAAVALCLFLMGGCEPTAPDEDRGIMTAAWGGTPWRGPATAMFTVDGALRITSSNTAALPEVAQMAVRVDFTGTGTYALDASAVAVDYITGGDVITARYSGTGPDAGILTIDEITPERISGYLRFDAASTSSYAQVESPATFAGAFEAILPAR